MFKVKSTVGGIFSLTLETASISLASGKMADLDQYCSKEWRASGHPNAVALRSFLAATHLVLLFDSEERVPKTPTKKVKILKKEEIATELPKTPSRPILGPEAKKSKTKAKKKKVEPKLVDFGTDPVVAEPEPVEIVIAKPHRSKPKYIAEVEEKKEELIDVDALSYTETRALAKELGIKSYGKKLSRLKDEIVESLKDA